MTNEKLSERVEKVGEGSRELDAEIATELFLPWDYAADWGSRGHDKPTAYPYTTSLDAARTLVPDGWSWSLGEMRGISKWRGWMNDHNTPDGLAVVHVDADAATPALALCAAALKARNL